MKNNYFTLETIFASTKNSALKNSSSKLYYKRNAFTLIEILIVITILLSLSVLGAIKYISVVEENNINLDLVNARTIAEGVKLAGVSNAIDLKTDVSNQPIDSAALSKYLDGEMKPKSKKYGANNAAFTYSISNQKITVSANGQILYPLPKTTNTTN